MLVEDLEVNQDYKISKLALISESDLVGPLTFLVVSPTLVLCHLARQLVSL